MSFRILFYLLLLIVFATSTCINGVQINGECFCSSADVLVKDKCQSKIFGCYQYEDGPICTKCRSSLVLKQGYCFLDGQNVTSNKVPALKKQEINFNFTELHGIQANKANDYFLKKYTGKGSAKNVEKLETKNGTIIVIDYQFADSTSMQRAVCIYSNNNIIELSYGPIPVMRKDPIAANNQIRKVLQDQLKDYFIYSFTSDKDIYKFDYMNINPNGKIDVLRIMAMSQSIFSPNFAANSMFVTKLNLQALAKEKIFLKYPQLKGLNFSPLHKYGDYYVAQIGLNTSISYKFSNFQFYVNSPLSLADTTNEISGGLLQDGFKLLSTFTDQQLTDSVSYIKKQFPETINSEIVRVQQKKADGTIYIIKLRSPVDLYEYEFKVIYSSNNKVYLSEGRKDSQLIYKKNYNYNQDLTFFTGYKLVEEKVITIPPVVSVEFKLYGGKKYFKLIYSNQQYLEFQVDIKTNSSTVLNPVVGNENMIKLLEDVKAKRVEIAVVMQFIRDVEPKAINSDIAQAQYADNTHTIVLVTPSGTYKAIVVDKGKDQLSLSEFKKISGVSCFTLTNQQVLSNENVTYMKKISSVSNQNITNYDLKLVQINETLLGPTYRLVYADPLAKQVEFYFNSINGKFFITKVGYPNNKLETIDNSLNTDYQKIVSYIQILRLTGSQNPYFVESNSTTIKGYYDDSRSLTELIIDKKTDKKIKQIISNRVYLLLPEYFYLTDLVFPGNFSQTEMTILSKVTQEAKKKYQTMIGNSSLVYASKANNNYTIMYKGSFGYVRVDAKYDAFGIISIGRAIMTGYRESDLSNCQKFGPTGKCLSCDKNQQVEFQGACFVKLEGCLVQAGTLCLKCEAGYLKLNYNCSKECSLFFW